MSAHAIGIAEIETDKYWRRGFWCIWTTQLQESFSDNAYRWIVFSYITNMRALDKRVLLLTEKNFKAIRADIGGIVRESFDAGRPNSVVTAVGRWLRDFEKPVAARKAASSKI